jgi:hypothetical protein
MNNKSLRFYYEATILVCLLKFFGEHSARRSGIVF